MRTPCFLVVFALVAGDPGHKEAREEQEPYDSGREGVTYSCQQALLFFENPHPAAALMIPMPEVPNRLSYAILVRGVAMCPT